MKINELLGTEFPIIQGGMAKIATGAFAAAVSKAGISLDEVDRFAFHQANQRILDHAIKKLKLDPAKCAGNIAHTGNTSAASVPILLDELVSSGQLRSGQRVLCAGFGGGLTWAGALLQLA